MYPKVSIVIVTWNGLNDTLECLESLKKINYTNYEVIIVDNASRDNTAEIVKKQFPELVVIESKENIGWSRATNVGIEYALKNGTEYFLLINNDTVIDSDILKNFMEAKDRYPEAGIFGAKIYYHSEPNRIWAACAKWDDYISDFFDAACNKLDNREEFNQVQEIDYVNGCGMFMKREVFERVGLFDPRYFFAFEEPDICYRAKKLGFKSIFIPEAKLWHKVSRSSGGKGNALFIYFATRNGLLWAQKNLPFSLRYAFYIGVIKKFFPHLLYSKGYPIIKRLYWDILQINKNHKNRSLKAKMLGIRDFILRRTGKREYIFRLNEEWKQLQNKRL